MHVVRLQHLSSGSGTGVSCGQKNSGMPCRGRGSVQLWGNIVNPDTGYD